MKSSTPATSAMLASPARPSPTTSRSRPSSARTFPERDDEFAKQLGTYESWADFETKLRERARRRKDDALNGQAKEQMLDEILASYNFPVPESFVQQQIDARLERGLRALAQQGMNADAMRQLDFARLREAQRDQAMQEVKASLLLDRIAEAENITVADEDLERELLMLSIQSARAAGSAAQAAHRGWLASTACANRCAARRQARTCSRS